MFTRYLLLAARVWDGWDESKHPRKSNGQFGAGGSASKSPLRRAAEVVKPKRKSRKSSKITLSLSFQECIVLNKIVCWFQLGSLCRNYLSRIIR